MDAVELRALQKPVKARMREDPEAARVTLKTIGHIDGNEILCKVETAREVVKAGLHPAAGGASQSVCSGDMMLEALTACAGVMLKAVATALDIRLRNGRVRAEGDLDFRGALGIESEAPVGFSHIRLRFELDTDASPEELARLIELTERYCIVYQTLRQGPQVTLETAALTLDAPAAHQDTVEGSEEVEALLQARLDALKAAAAHAL